MAAAPHTTVNHNCTIFFPSSTKIDKFHLFLSRTFDGDFFRPEGHLFLFLDVRRGFFRTNDPERTVLQ